MKAFILTSLACLSSLLVGCASANKELELEKRAGYEMPPLPPMALGNGKGAIRYVPTRVPERVTVPWLFPHELPSKDYFWGAWLSVIVAPESWEMTKVKLPETKKRGPRTDSNLKPKPLKIMKATESSKA